MLDLQALDLSLNNLTAVGPPLLDSLSTLQFLELQQNKIRCVFGLLAGFRT